MDSDNKYDLMTNAIIKILNNGVALNADALHFIDSTFSTPTIEQIKRIIDDPTNCEREALIQLICFPDESIQARLEPLVERLSFQQNDVDALLHKIVSKHPAVMVHLPDERGSFPLSFSFSAAEHFICHLNLTKLLDQRLVDGIGRYVDEALKNLTKVKLRNSRIRFTENNIVWMVSFFKTITAMPDEFIESLNFALEFLEGVMDEANIYRALMDLKKFYISTLERAEEFEAQLKKINMETLILQGIKTPYFDKADARYNIKIIDRISLSIHGKTEYFKELIYQDTW